jgi:hypothetical protein
VFTPIPNASVTAATTVNAGARRSVGREFLEPSEAIHVVDLLTHEQRVAESTPSGTPRIVLSHT